MARHLSATNMGNCGLISCHFQPPGVGLQPGSAAEGKLRGSQGEILAMKFQAKDLHGCRGLAGLTNAVF